jgi:two-component system chemotaxis response regulator CheY
MAEQQQLKVLVVDDSTYIRNLLGIILRKEGMIVHYAEDGVEALEKFKEVHPHIVFLDNLMPRMNGIEALREMKKINPEVKAVMVSSLSAHDSVMDSKAAGAAYYILKPFTPEKVKDILKRIL